jgi:hypothetical protein
MVSPTRPVRTRAALSWCADVRRILRLINADMVFGTHKGYRGDQPLPTFSFTPKTKRVRPAFELFEYRRLLRSLIKWQRDCPNDTWLHARRLLTDYVLILANSGMRVCCASLKGTTPTGLPRRCGCHLLLDRGKESVEVEIQAFDFMGVAHDPLQRELKRTYHEQPRQRQSARLCEISVTEDRLIITGTELKRGA